MLKAPTQSVRRARRARPNRKLFELRLIEGLSPNDLAYRAGLSGNAVRMAEAGILPHPRTQKAIADVLGVRTIDIWPLEGQR